MDSADLRDRVENSPILGSFDPESKLELYGAAYGSCLGILAACYERGIPEVVKLVDAFFPPLDIPDAA